MSQSCLRVLYLYYHLASPLALTMTVTYFWMPPTYLSHPFSTLQGECSFSTTSLPLPPTYQHPTALRIRSSTEMTSDILLDLGLQASPWIALPVFSWLTPERAAILLALGFTDMIFSAWQEHHILFCLFTLFLGSA